MKRSAVLIFCIASLTVIMSACSTDKQEPLFYEDGIVNLNGPWSDQEVFETSLNSEEEMLHLSANAVAIAQKTSSDDYLQSR